jgi:hypothetical protein
VAGIERRRPPNALAKAAEARILTIRGKHVIVDSDLAAFYDVETAALVRQMKRNQERFPPDFAFQLSDAEFAVLRRQFGAAGWAKRRTRPWVFTEQGALMASGVLRSGKAADVGVEVARAFVKMRDRLRQIGSLTSALDDLRAELTEQIEERTLELRAGQAELSAQVDTLAELMKVVQQALRALHKSEKQLPPVEPRA